MVSAGRTWAFAPSRLYAKGSTGPAPNAKWGTLTLALLLPLLTACTQATNECVLYAEARITMPRPLPDNELGEWVAVTDSRFTEACR